MRLWCVVVVSASMLGTTAGKSASHLTRVAFNWPHTWWCESIIPSHHRNTSIGLIVRTTMQLTRNISSIATPKTLNRIYHNFCKILSRSDQGFRPIFPYFRLFTACSQLFFLSFLYFLSPIQPKWCMDLHAKYAKRGVSAQRCAI